MPSAIAIKECPLNCELKDQKPEKGSQMSPQNYNWSEIAKNPKFVELHKRKQRFLFGWWIFSTIFYFLLPIGAAYTPDLFKVKVLGNINFGYLFALSQFFVSWGIAMYYAHVANRDFDRLTRELVSELAK
jgi:uncharacterized membrane protein (DUF485 family)